MKAKILEVFRSIQGEGKYIGATQVFVRLFECNMHCVWCDTPASIGDTSRNYKEIECDDLVAQIMALSYQCHSISVTGGEPLLQAEFLKEFLPKLKAQGLKIYLETNGVLPDQLSSVITWVDTVSMDLKLPSSTGEKAFWQEHEQFLNVARGKDLFVKMVISNETTDDDITKAVELIKKFDSNLLFIIQPNHFDMSKGIMEKAITTEKYASSLLSNVRVIPQVHKMMKVR